jgi:hypothetical protein
MHNAYTPQTHASGVAPPAFCFLGGYSRILVRFASFNTFAIWRLFRGFAWVLVQQCSEEAGSTGTHVFGDWHLCCLRRGPSFVLSPALALQTGGRGYILVAGPRTMSAMASW